MLLQKYKHGTYDDMAGFMVMYIWIYVFYNAYNYSGLVRQVSGISNANVSA